ncbi:HK97 family phage prohead protease [Acinetobacter sp. A1]|uniref:HK97 family phage prohead protease n=1 Tax=Acinetobacter sp. A1 TaxID=401467 RepID=UPI0014481BBB|nr:HK97 family phage prohead protease [Acinetobacter sp. A1]
MNKIFQNVSIKAASDGQRIITAIANSGALDRTNEIVSVQGIEYDEKNLPPLLWQHQHDKILGRILSLKKTQKGLEMTAQIAKYETPSDLQQLTDSVWESVKMGVIKSCSIGFRPLDYDRSQGTTVWLKSELLEVSLVSVPAESGAKITSHKAAKQRSTGAVNLSGVPHTVVNLSDIPSQSIASALTANEKLLGAKLAYMDTANRKSLLEPFINEFGAERADMVKVFADSLRGEL